MGMQLLWPLADGRKVLTRGCWCVAASLTVPAQKQTRTSRVMSTKNNFNDPRHRLASSRNSEPRYMRSAAEPVPAVENRHRRALGLRTKNA